MEHSLEAQYGEKFGVLPPMIYMPAPGSQQYKEMIIEALQTGKPIDPDEIIANLPPDVDI